VTRVTEVTFTVEIGPHPHRVARSCTESVSCGVVIHEGRPGERGTNAPARAASRRPQISQLLVHGGGGGGFDLVTRIVAVER
jgi:hypothetical protein